MCRLHCLAKGEQCKFENIFDSTRFEKAFDIRPTSYVDDVIHGFWVKGLSEAEIVRSVKGLVVAAKCFLCAQ